MSTYRGISSLRGFDVVICNESNKSKVTPPSLQKTYQKKWAIISGLVKVFLIFLVNNGRTSKAQRVLLPMIFSNLHYRSHPPKFSLCVVFNLSLAYQLRFLSFLFSFFGLTIGSLIKKGKKNLESSFICNRSPKDRRRQMWTVFTYAREAWSSLSSSKSSIHLFCQVTRKRSWTSQCLRTWLIFFPCPTETLFSINNKGLQELGTSQNIIFHFSISSGFYYSWQHCTVIEINAFIRTHINWGDRLEFPVHDKLIIQWYN